MKFVSKLSKTSLVCNELQVKDYKEIIKCSMGDQPDVCIFIETICNILSNNTNKPAEYIKSLSILDVLYLLTDIRLNSLGMCNLVITQGDKKINLELNLEIARNQISSLFNFCEETISYDNIHLTLAVPSLSRLYESYEHDYIPYLHTCAIKEEKTFEISTNAQANEVFDLLPPKLAIEGIKKFNTMIQNICTVDLLKGYELTSQQLIVLPTIEFLMWFTKLLFGEDLGTFYDNLFSLSYSGKMNAEYIENLPVGEYNYFIGLLKQTLAPKDSDSSFNSNNIPDISDGF